MAGKSYRRGGKGHVKRILGGILFICIGIFLDDASIKMIFVRFKGKEAFNVKPSMSRQIR